MSKYSDLKIDRDVAQATSARFVKAAATHIVAGHLPFLREQEIAKAAVAKIHAKRWAEKADLLSDKLSKLAATEIDPTA